MADMIEITELDFDDNASGNKGGFGKSTGSPRLDGASSYSQYYSNPTGYSGSF